MIDRMAFLQKVYKPHFHEMFDFDKADAWLSEHIVPNMEAAAKRGEREYTFGIDTATLAERGLSVGMLRKVLNIADYQVVTIPTSPLRDDGHRTVDITIKW